MSAELPKMPTAFEVVYEFPSPFGGVHRKLDSNRWNGSTPTTSQPVYSQDQLITFAQEAARQAMEQNAALCERIARSVTVVTSGQEGFTQKDDRASRLFHMGAANCASAIRALTHESEKRHG